MHHAVLVRASLAALVVGCSPASTGSWSSSSSGGVAGSASSGAGSTSSSGGATGGTTVPDSGEDATDASGGTPPEAGPPRIDSGADASCAPPLVPSPPYLLSADGVTDTYTLLGKVLGGTPLDSPDCSHTVFGPHVTQTFDCALGKPVFDFWMHATPDNDRCVAVDRQRNELKVYDASPASLKGYSGDTVSYQWKFHLADGFQPSPDFCHIHQIKGGDGAGANGAPVITITPRHGSPDVLQIIYSSPAQAEDILTSAPLALFLGTWVEASETIRYDATSAGSYALTLRRVSDGAMLLSFESSSLVMWSVSTAASPTTYCRPKWGIYRSLNSPTYLRDEQILFDDFCVAKGGCPVDLP